MKFSIGVIVGILFFLNTKSQTVIEMTHPGDANLVLLQVNKPEDADIVVYKTDVKDEYEEWNCKWKFKKWGFSNFSIYLAKTTNDSLLDDDEMGIKYSIQGRIYFTNNKDEAGYKTPGFHLEGVFEKGKTINTPQSKESKKKASENEEQKDNKDGE